MVTDAPRASNGSSPKPASDKAVILLCEDDDIVRRVTTEILRRNGYTVVPCEGGEQALDHARRAERLEILVTDVVMPGMQGIELAQRIVEVHPGLRVLYVSGYPSETSHAEPGQRVKRSMFLQKPYTPATLLETLQKLL